MLELIMSKWIVLAESCPSCGSEIAIKIVNRRPTKKDEEEVKDAVGGMFCIQAYLAKVDADGNAYIEKDC